MSYAICYWGINSYGRCNSQTTILEECYRTSFLCLFVQHFLPFCTELRSNFCCSQQKAFSGPTTNVWRPLSNRYWRLIDYPIGYCTTASGHSYPVTRIVYPEHRGMRQTRLSCCMANQTWLERQTKWIFLVPPDHHGTCLRHHLPTVLRPWNSYYGCYAHTLGPVILPSTSLTRP